ncbi:MAG: hypothetical protein IJX52_07575 [Oscillibacter sp.]|nr:hypothetical protein [Oscillibacter sp.]
MYNRYIRNENGTYARIPQEEKKEREEHRQEQRQEHHREERPPSPPSKGDGLTGILRHFLDQFHLEGVDTGDLLLLGLLFLLSQEKADEETLIALGLLLIL